MSEWTPPAAGVFCWAEIPAQDVARAKSFYSTVFNWTFRESVEGSNYPSDKFAFFDLPDKKFPMGGGIVQVPKDCHTTGKGAVKLYLYVHDLEGTMEKIVANGGTKHSEVEPESDFGLQMQFEDSEGNRFGIYTMAPKKKDAAEKKE